MFRLRLPNVFEISVEIGDARASAVKVTSCRTLTQIAEDAKKKKNVKADASSCIFREIREIAAPVSEAGKHTRSIYDFFFFFCARTTGYH